MLELTSSVGSSALTRVELSWCVTLLASRSYWIEQTCMLRSGVKFLVVLRFSYRVDLPFERTGMLLCAVLPRFRCGQRSKLSWVLSVCDC